MSVENSKEEIKSGSLVGFELEQKDPKTKTMVEGWRKCYGEPLKIFSMPDQNHVVLADQSGNELPLGAPLSLHIGFLKPWLVQP